MTTFEYAPAPESRAIVDIKPSYGLFIGGEFVDGHGDSFKTINPATEETLAEVAEADDADVDRAVKAARRAFERLVPDARQGARQVPLPDRADHPGAQPRVRGARVHRRRQADQGVAATSTCRSPPPTSSTTPAGPTSSSTPSPERDPRAARRRRPDHPVELPAADARLEDRAGARRRQHRRAQAGRDDAAHRAALRRGLPAGRAARRASSTSSPATAAPARRSSGTRTSTRSRSPARPRSARRSRGHRRHRQEGSRSSSAARPRTSSSTTRRSTRRSRASSTASTSTRATSAAPARGCSCRSRSPTRSMAKLKRRMETLRVGDPLDKNTDIGAINSASSSTGSPSWPSRRGRGRRALSPPCELPDSGLLVPADGLHGRGPGAPDRAGGDLRARCSRC